MKKKIKLKLNPARDWPAARVEMWPLSDILPYPRNARMHPPEQIEMLARLMREHGVDQPIVVDEDGIILKGHGRKLAAALAGFDSFPIVQHHGLSEADKMAMRLQDNQVALLSGWDSTLIRGEIQALQLKGFDIPLLGFDQAAIARFTAGSDPGARDPEDTPEPPRRPVTRAGDLWELGDHRVLCGDATARETWGALLAHQRAALVFTDPPYGVSYKAQSFEVIEGDDKRRDELYGLLVATFRQLEHFADDRAAFYIWHASSTREDFAQAMKAAGLQESQYIIWVKPGAVLGHADYQWQHEPCFYAHKAGHAAAFYGNRAESTVWHVEAGGLKRDVAATVGNGVLLLDGAGASLYVQSRAPKGRKLRQIRIADGAVAYLTGADRQDGTVWEVSRDPHAEHPTQKPVELARRAMENSSQPGSIVADAFLGSGTTLIAAELTGRRCYGTELDPRYCDVVVQRWERFTGKLAILAETGRPFAETSRERAKGTRAKRASAASAGRQKGKANDDQKARDNRKPIRRRPAPVDAGVPAAVGEPPVRPGVRPG